VDGLSRRAAAALHSETPDPSTAKLPSTLIEMHGSLFKTKCLACKDEAPNFDSPICPALAESAAGPGDSALEEEGREIPLDDLPRCAKCGGLLRPGVVWFGEAIESQAAIANMVASVDLLLVIGTSSTVRRRPFYSVLLVC
jgi:NAD-dependent deacetylase sirtuin 5